MCGIASPRCETWRDTHDDGRDARLALPRRPPQTRRHLPPRVRPPTRPAVADRRYAPRPGTDVRARSNPIARSAACPGVCDDLHRGSPRPAACRSLPPSPPTRGLPRWTTARHGGPRLALGAANSLSPARAGSRVLARDRRPWATRAQPAGRAPSQRFWSAASAGSGSSVWPPDFPERFPPGLLLTALRDRRLARTRRPCRPRCRSLARSPSATLAGPQIASFQLPP